MTGGFIFMCAFISLIAIVGVLYFNHKDKLEEKEREANRRHYKAHKPVAD